MAKIRDLTNMMLGEIAPQIDEIIAHMFSEIDSNPNLTLAEKQEEKKRGMSKLAKGSLGGAGLAATSR